jgi:hypothetical protein
MHRLIKLILIVGAIFVAVVIVLRIGVKLIRPQPRTLRIPVQS